MASDALDSPPPDAALPAVAPDASADAPDAPDAQAPDAPPAPGPVSPSEATGESTALLASSVLEVLALETDASGDIRVAGSAAADPEHTIEERYLLELSAARWQMADTAAESSQTPSRYPDLWAAVDLQFLDELDVAAAIAHHAELKVVEQKQLSDITTDPEWAAACGEDDLSAALALPIRGEAGEDGLPIVTLLVADPSHPSVPALVRLLDAYGTVQTLVAPRSWITAELTRMAARSGGQLVDVSRSLFEIFDVASAICRVQSGTENADSAIAESVNAILAMAVAKKASDLHIQGLPDGYELRIRVDGELQVLDRVNKHVVGGNATDALALRDAIVGNIFARAGMNASEAPHMPLDGRMTFMAPGDQKIDIRINTTPLHTGDRALKLVLRLQGAVTMPLSLKGRGLRKTQEATIRTGTRGEGVTLVTGPTGSGKTTLLHGIIGELVSEKVNIVTMEDPVERDIPGTVQVAVRSEPGHKMHMTQVFRAVLRADPDTILAGEVRDSDTARLAFQAANTGHGVFTTLHTNTALGSIERLRGLGVEPYVLAQSIKLLIAQRLVRRLCPLCHERLPVLPPKNLADPAYVAALEANRQRASLHFRTLLKEGYDPQRTTLASFGVTAADLKHTLPEAEAAALTPLLATQPLYTLVPYFKVSTGCTRCSHTGYSGRTAVISIVPPTPALRAAMLKDAPLEELEQIAYASGARSLFAEGLFKALRGETSLAEICKHMGSDFHPTKL